MVKTMFMYLLFSYLVLSVFDLNYMVLNGKYLMLESMDSFTFSFYTLSVFHIYGKAFSMC